MALQDLKVEDYPITSPTREQVAAMGEAFSKTFIKELPNCVRCNMYRSPDGKFYPVISPDGGMYIDLTYYIST